MLSGHESSAPGFLSAGAAGDTTDKEQQGGRAGVEEAADGDATAAGAGAAAAAQVSPAAADDLGSPGASREGEGRQLDGSDVAIEAAAAAATAMPISSTTPAARASPLSTSAEDAAGEEEAGAETTAAFGGQAPPAPTTAAPTGGTEEAARWAFPAFRPALAPFGEGERDGGGGGGVDGGGGFARSSRSNRGSDARSYSSWRDSWVDGDSTPDRSACKSMCVFVWGTLRFCATVRCFVCDRAYADPHIHCARGCGYL